MHDKRLSRDGFLFLYPDYPDVPCYIFVIEPTRNAATLNFEFNPADKVPLRLTDKSRLRRMRYQSFPLSLSFSLERDLGLVPPNVLIPGAADNYRNLVTRLTGRIIGVTGETRGLES